MAKAATATKRSSSTAVTKTGGGGVPAHLRGVKMSGEGVSTDAADNLIPMARVLQKNSPEVEKRDPAYIKGAEPGDIYIKNAPNPIIKGEKGFHFQPCYFQKGFVEWLPRNKGGGGGGGFVTMHQQQEPADTTSRPHPEDPSKTIRVRKSNGNLIVETRYHGGFIYHEDGEPSPLVIPFAGSGHSVSKAWMMLMNRKVFDGNKAASWAIIYQFTTKLKSAGGNTWHLFEITDAGEEDDQGLNKTMWVPTLEDYERGAALYKSLATGAQRFDAGAAADADETDQDGKM